MRKLCSGSVTKREGGREGGSDGGWEEGSEGGRVEKVWFSFPSIFVCLFIYK